jgi:hypothetical protein
MNLNEFYYTVHYSVRLTYVCMYVFIWTEKKPSTKVLLDEDVRVKINDCESIVYKQVKLQDSRWPMRLRILLCLSKMSLLPICPQTKVSG